MFEEEDALDKLEAFPSLSGPAFYGLPVNKGTLTLQRADHPVPETLGEGETCVVPFHAGETLRWKMAK